MHGFRQALNTGARIANNAFAHARRAAVNVDRTLGSAARLYSQLAPTLAPLARELFGEGRASMAHKAISDGIASYQNVRGKVQRANLMAETLARSVRKELPSFRLNNNGV